MTFHTILHKSEQYIEALKRARQLTDELSETINRGIDDPDKQVGYFFIYYFTFGHNSLNKSRQLAPFPK